MKPYLFLSCLLLSACAAPPWAPGGHIYRDHHSGYYRSHCPPGLAKKGFIPPEQAKNGEEVIHYRKAWFFTICPPEWLDSWKTSGWTPLCTRCSGHSIDCDWDRFSCWRSLRSKQYVVLWIWDEQSLWRIEIGNAYIYNSKIEARLSAGFFVYMRMSAFGTKQTFAYGN